VMIQLCLVVGSFDAIKTALDIVSVACFTDLSKGALSH